jgi:hypothetical protein
VVRLAGDRALDQPVAAGGGPAADVRGRPGDSSRPS